MITSPKSTREEADGVSGQLGVGGQSPLQQELFLCLGSGPEYGYGHRRCKKHNSMRPCALCALS